MSCGFHEVEEAGCALLHRVKIPEALELGAAAKLTQSLLTGPVSVAIAGHGLFENGSVPPSL